MMHRSCFCPLLINKIIREHAQTSNTLDTLVGLCTCGGSYCATNSPCLLTHWPNETQLHYREAWSFSSASLSSVIRHINAGNRWFHLENSGMVVFNVWAGLGCVRRSTDKLTAARPSLSTRMSLYIRNDTSIWRKLLFFLTELWPVICLFWGGNIKNPKRLHEDPPKCAGYALVLTWAVRK